MDKVYNNQGPAGLIKFVKLVRTAFLLFLSKEEKGKSVVGIKLTKDGIPLVLGDLIPKIRAATSADIKYLQLLSTILWGSRSLKVGRIPNTDPITQPASKLVPSGIGKYYGDFWRAIGIWPSKRVPKSLLWKRYHFTTKSGPNGHALWCHLTDLLALPTSLVDSLKVCGGEKFSNSVDILKKGIELIPFLPRQTGGKIRKLSYFPDREDKVRVIAILDYFSQSVLKPFHSYLLNVLRKIPQDMTFNQGDFRKILDNQEIYYSVDLSNATDRFPMEVICNLLKAKFPNHYIDSWKDIMVGYPFSYKDPTGKEENLSYSVGNPMGAYSSWSSFALAHHYIVYYCCRELGVEWKTLPYCLLGDDIVIAHREVAELYISTIHSLGCETSELKTHKSTTLYEFAKRLIWNGLEITPFPISALKESKTRYYMLVNLLLESERKGFVSVEGVPRAISLLYSLIDHKPRRFCGKMESKSVDCELIMKVMRGLLTACDALTGIASNHHLPITQALKYNNQCDSAGILSSVCVELFADSNPENEDPKKKTGKPLGLLATLMVIHLSDLKEDNGPLGFDLIDNSPILQNYGAVEDLFMKLKREAIRIDTVAGGDWPLLMRAMTIPISDEIFTIRTAHAVPMASANLSRKVVERLKLLVEFQALPLDPDTS